MATKQKALPRTPAQIFVVISEVLQDALGVDPDEVMLDASIPDDLGAESIDFLDIIFRVEQVTGIRISRNEIFPRIVSDVNLYSPLTASLLKEIKDALPRDQELPKVTLESSTVADLFTVRYLCQAVARLLEVPWKEPV